MRRLIKEIIIVRGFSRRSLTTDEKSSDEVLFRSTHLPNWITGLLIGISRNIGFYFTTNFTFCAV